MLVKNIRNTADLRCKCNHWLDHWMRYTNKRVIPTCSKFQCSQEAKVGGHVIKCTDTDKKWYIIPLCIKHNSIHNKGCFKINKNTKLVSANVSKTCRNELKK